MKLWENTYLSTSDGRASKNGPCGGLQIEAQNERSLN